MTEMCTCGCCEGIEILTPEKIANRPGLDAIRYRAGTHASFFETMLAALTLLDMRDLDPEALASDDSERLNPLLKLKTRDLFDPSIAMLDAWALVADVLTFYQERIANEGFLRTARERRSILELANLVGYKLQPGVAATAYLAFTMEQNAIEKIPLGTRAQSIPGPGEFPQVFETADEFEARAVWNELKPRVQQPQDIQKSTLAKAISIYFKGTDTGLNINDPMLFVFGDDPNQQVLHRVDVTEEDSNSEWTKVATLPFSETNNQGNDKNGSPNSTTTPFENLKQILAGISKDASFQPQNMVRLNRNKKQIYSAKTDIAPQLLINQNRLFGQNLYGAWGRTRKVTPAALQSVQAFRVKAIPFGANSPGRARVVTGPEGDPNFGIVTTFDEWLLDESVIINRRILNLDTIYDEIKPQTWASIKSIDTNGDTKIKPVFVNSVNKVSVSDYGITAEVTQLSLSSDWIDDDDFKPRIEREDDGSIKRYENGNIINHPGLDSLRDITIYAQSESLELAQAPIVRDVEDDSITLNGLFDALTSGRWIVVSGERTDVIAGSEEGRVQASELVMIASVEQTFDPELPNDTPHTVLKLANKLAYQYKRDTVTIFGNVVRASQGETKTEILGSGDSSKPLQTFALKQSPLTYTAAVNPSGVESSLEVRVNEVKWHETDSLAEKQPQDRLFITKTDNENTTTVQFGNGEQGLRVPSGQENVRAVYRVGIGASGNVKAKQISMLATKPLGVKSVSNPLPASGGANREELNQARRNAPIPLRALDRTVSVSDFADFARAFSGIGKADAVRMSDGRRELVHLTIAGTNDIPIDRNSDLFRNLKRALHEFGDPNQPLQLALRELKLIIVFANIRILPDYKWEAVEPQIRSTLLDKFGFENRSMGQDVIYSEVVSTIQAVDGVDFVDIDALDALSSEEVIDNLEGLAEILNQKTPKKRIRVHKARVDFATTDPEKRIRPAQLAMLSPNVPDTIVLSELSR